MGTYGHLDIGSALHRQEELERQCVEGGRTRWWERYHQAQAAGRAHTAPAVQRWLSFWMPEFEAEVRRRRAAIKRDDYVIGSALIQPFVSSTPARVMAAMTLSTIADRMFDHPQQHGLKYTSISKHIGEAVIAYACWKRNAAEYKAVFEGFRRRGVLTPGQIKKWAQGTGDDSFAENRVQVTIGSWLLESLLTTAAAGPYGPDQRWEPAFTLGNMNYGVKKCRVLIIDERVFDTIATDNDWLAGRSPRLVPMVYPPHPWTEDEPGGYIRIRRPLIKTHNALHKSETYGRSDLTILRRAVNTIGRVPLELNPTIVSTVARLMEMGGGIAGLPLSNPHRPPKRLPKSVTDPTEVKRQKRAVWTWRRKEVARKAMGREVWRVVTAAEGFAGDPMYLPHFADFRGRLYPVPTVLTHHSPDWQCAMMRFRTPVEPDEYWQAIHTANMWGYDKVSHEEQVAWAKEHADDMRRAARDPIGTVEWWGQADKPFGFLACCLAWDRPEDAARLAVQRDGSCNGLQHLAAMTRDAEVAALVNLRPSNRPEDIYSEVAKVARGIMEMHKQDGRPEPDIVEKYIGDKWRKAFKPRVMTDVYGVKMIGARRQFAEFLESVGCAADPFTCNRGHRCGVCQFCLSGYLVGVSTEAIDDVYGRSRDVLDWFRECSDSVTKGEGQFFSWTAPTGLYVMQHYGGGASKRVHLPFANVRIRSNDTAPYADKHELGAAPNIIHSIDAAHMHMAINGCDGAGVELLAKHDAYLSHSGDCKVMGSIVAETFADIHRQNVLEGLRDQWSQMYPETHFSDPPMVGDWDVDEVMHARHAFA